MARDITRYFANQGLADGASFALAYPAGRSSDDYAAAGHAISVRQRMALYLDALDDFTIEFGDDNITITWAAGVALPAGAELSISLERVSTIYDSPSARLTVLERVAEQTLRATDRRFGCDPTGVKDITAAAVRLFRNGGDIYFPEGDYLVAGAGPDAGGVAVELTRSLRVTCHPKARFLTNGLDNDFFRFTVPADGAGLPTTKIHFEWYGGVFDQSNQKVSTSVPSLETYPAPSGKQGQSATCDGISLRFAYNDGTGLKNAVGVCKVSGVEFYAGEHWDLAGGDTGIFVGEGADLALVEDCTFRGSRDQGIYGSWDGTGVNGGFIELRRSRFLNCFFGCAVKRSVDGFSINDNDFENCITAVNVNHLVGKGTRNGAVFGNRIKRCEVGVRLDYAFAVDVYSNKVTEAGAYFSNNTKTANYGAPKGIWVRGCRDCVVWLNTGDAVGADFAADTTNFLYVESFDVGGEVGVVNSTYNRFMHNFCRGWRSVGFEAFDEADYNQYIENWGLDVTNNLIVKDGPNNSTERRVDGTTLAPIHMTPVYFANGTAALPILARRSQPSTGFFFDTNKVGVSVAEVERIAANNVGVAFNGATPAARSTYGAATGTATRTTFDTATVTLEQLAQRVKAIIDDFKTNGQFG